MSDFEPRKDAFQQDDSSGESSDRKIGKLCGKRKQIEEYDDARRKEIRETNRIAARECRARKKHLMLELEKTVRNLTAEHESLLRINEELSIRLETLERTASLGLKTSLNPAIAGVVPPLGANSAQGSSQSSPAATLFSTLNSEYQLGASVLGLGTSAAVTQAQELVAKHVNDYSRGRSQMAGHRY